MEAQRGARVVRELDALAAVGVGVEDEAARIGRFHQHEPQRRRAVRAGRGKARRLGQRLGRLRRGEPACELVERLTMGNGFHLTLACAPGHHTAEFVNLPSHGCRRGGGAGTMTRDERPLHRPGRRARRLRRGDQAGLSAASPSASTPTSIPARARSSSSSARSTPPTSSCPTRPSGSASTAARSMPTARSAASPKAARGRDGTAPSPTSRSTRCSTNSCAAAAAASAPEHQVLRATTQTLRLSFLEAALGGQAAGGARRRPLGRGRDPGGDRERPEAAPARRPGGRDPARDHGRAAPALHPQGSRHPVEAPVPLLDAVLGGTITVPTIHGAVAVKVPKGSNSGSTLRLRGKGIETGGTSGDHYVKLKLVLPDPPDPELTAALERWAQRQSPRSAAAPVEPKRPSATRLTTIRDPGGAFRRPGPSCRMKTLRSALRRSGSGARMTDAKPLMAGKRGLIMGVANDRSIAWGIAKAVAEHGAELAFTYQGEVFAKRVRPLAESLGSTLVDGLRRRPTRPASTRFRRAGRALGAARFPGPRHRLFRFERAQGPLCRYLARQFPAQHGHLVLLVHRRCAGARRR